MIRVNWYDILFIYIKGNGTKKRSETPCLVNLPHRAKCVRTGLDKSSFILCENGHLTSTTSKNLLYAFGSNSNGKLVCFFILFT